MKTRFEVESKLEQVKILIGILAPHNLDQGLVGEKTALEWMLEEGDEGLGRGILNELVALKQAIRAGDFDRALELVKANDAPFLWTKDGQWLGG